MTVVFFLLLAEQTTCNDFVRGKRRKALRRCPDMSRKRDSIVVSALSFSNSFYGGKNML